ncbi:MAG: hypothetical protein GXP55_25565, partial [Deltaproteobacteria bacterium]|nr:hypothetical protein [Deltaproteobacteria bacterium]
MRRSSWRDELPPEALAVLDSAEVDECSDAAFERIGKRVALGLGVGAAVSGAAGAAQASPGCRVRRVRRGPLQR